ncbi:hypothetical protein ACLOJK_015918 [Asimina triloba]
MMRKLWIAEVGGKNHQEKSMPEDNGMEETSAEYSGSSSAVNNHHSIPRDKFSTWPGSPGQNSGDNGGNGSGDYV